MLVAGFSDTLNWFLVMGVDICMPSFMFKIMVLIDLLEARIESAELVTSFQNGAKKEKFLSGVFNNGVLKALPG